MINENKTDENKIESGRQRYQSFLNRKKQSTGTMPNTHINNPNITNWELVIKQANEIKELYIIGKFNERFSIINELISIIKEIEINTISQKKDIVDIKNMSERRVYYACER